MTRTSIVMLVREGQEVGLEDISSEVTRAEAVVPVPVLVFVSVSLQREFWSDPGSGCSWCADRRMGTGRVKRGRDHNSLLSCSLLS